MENGERQKVSTIQALPLVSVCVVVFLTGIFLEGFLLFHRYFEEADLFTNICQMEIFLIVYLPKECLLNK